MNIEAEAVYQAALQLPQSQRVELVGRLRRGDQPFINSNLELEIFKLTKSMFPGEVSVETSADPEFPETTYLVFRVAGPARGSDDESIDRELRWHRKVSQIAPDARTRIRLLTE